MNRRFFTSESVTEGHPDKLCDKVSDSVLDAIFSQDKMARVACETCCNTGFVMVMGEITTTAVVDIADVVRRAVCEVGYDNSEVGFNGNTCAVMLSIDKQSPDIALGVDNSIEVRDGGDKYDQNGAGDQGMMFGYATNETESLMPMPIYLAHQLAAKLTAVRKTNELTYLRPDGKAQVTVEYIDDKPKRVDAVVVSTQHSEDVDLETIRRDIKKHVISAVIPAELIDENTKFYINPTGRFVVGGPVGDSGLTGRKIIVDTYGGYCPHGGGAFSGKDPTKVDRSAAYMARHVCKNIVASGIADKCQLDVAYAIGVAKPVSIQVNTFNTSKYSNEQIQFIIDAVFDLRPSALIDYLGLRAPIYANTSNYGHFGRDGFSWEDTNKAKEIAQLAKTL